MIKDNKIFITRSIMPTMEEYIEEIKPLWDSHWLTNMGAIHKKLEERLKEYLEVEDISLFSNGHMSLELLIQAMKLEGEVITTPFTFVSTTHAIVRNRLTPVFCDINSEDFTMDASKIESLITDKTSAIIPVHVYGNVCNIEEIERIAKKYDLKVIYDAAHAFGVKYKGRGIGSFGDASIFSFHATKIFNTIEGGAVCHNDRSLGLRLYQLKNFGIRNEEVVDGVGANAKMNEFQAAMGMCNLRYIEEEIKKRRQVTERYIHNLLNVDGIYLRAVQNDVESNYSYFPVVFDENVYGSTRNEVYYKLMENNIFTRKYFYPLTNMFHCFHGKYDVGQTPTALHVARRVLVLPLYGDLNYETIDKICEIILSLKK